jgi:integrase
MPDNFLCNLRSPNNTFAANASKNLTVHDPKRHSTASKYRSWITHHVKPKWGGIPIRKVKPLLVEEWLMSLKLAPKSKGHVRSIMHILFNWAMKWEFIEIDRMNPMSLVRVEGSSKRLRQPRILSVKEFRGLLDELQEPIRTMCIVAVSRPEGKRTRGFAVGRFRLENL